MTTEKMRSKFRLFPYMLIVCLTMLVIVSQYIILRIVVAKGTPPPMAVFMFLLFLGLILFCLIWIEFRKVMTRVTINDQHITIKYWGGWGMNMYFDYHVLKGYKTTTLPSMYENYEYMYIISDNKTVIVLSAFYHKNYKEMQGALDKKINRISHERFRVIPYFKHMLS